MATLFEVNLIDEESVKGFDKAAKSNYHNELTRTAGEALAQVARKRMSEMIAKKHKYNIGASGASSENLQVEQQTAGLNQTRWAVVEGGATRGNEMIRRGLKRRAYGKKKYPPMSRLAAWARDKGMDLKEMKDGKEVKTKLKRYVKGHWRTSKSGNRHYVNAYAVTSEKGTGDVALRALSRIRNKLRKFGTFHQKSNWYKNSPYPKGRGRFDYPAWTVRQTGYFQTAVNNVAGKTVKAYIDYLTSGRKSAYLGKEFSKANTNAG